jgi:hypothetical protein
MPWVREADALLVDGGEAVYLAEWIRRSGLADLLPELHETVWVGISAGSMALAPRGPEFVDRHPGGTDETLGLVDFSIFPHLTTRAGPETRPRPHRWAEGIRGRAYAIDDQTAIRVVDGEVDVISRATGSCSTVSLPPGASTARPSASPSVRLARIHRRRRRRGVGERHDAEHAAGLDRAVEHEGWPPRGRRARGRRRRSG